ncbi:hypothetical protein [Candidatus Electrothrix sp.]|uniref:hypothetical protein n=1 Tax=Candidatus Electrothrix sp. TaxID=2170559 RepID=UPI004057BFCF
MSSLNNGDSALPGRNIRNMLLPYHYFLFFCLSLLLTGCNSQADELDQASRSYKAHRDYASLEVINGHLRKGMAQSKVEDLLGEADYSPIAGQYYYSSDRSEVAGSGKERMNVTVGLVVEYRDDQGQLTEQLQSFWLGRIRE